MKLLLAESDDFSKEVISFLDQKFDLTILNNLSQIEFESAFLEYDIIWFRLNYNVLNIDNEKGIRCKYIVCPVTGTNHISNDFLEKNRKVSSNFRIVVLSSFSKKTPRIKGFQNRSIMEFPKPIFFKLMTCHIVTSANTPTHIF